MDVAKSFITEFHNLEGTTTGAKRKSFSKLLGKYSSLHENHTVLNLITSQLTPQTQLEKIFYTDFLICFHRFDELCRQFLDQDEIVVSKVKKQKWFYKRIFEENRIGFVNKFLPTLSYSLRIKLLKKLNLVLEENESDGIFDDLVNRYGAFVASNLLISCSCTKIEQVLKSYPIQLSTNELKQLYNRESELLQIYIEERIKHEENSEFLDNQILKYIAMKNPDMFCSLKEKYKINRCRVGKRTTKKFLQRKKDAIVAKPELYVEHLNLTRLVRKLGKDFEQVYVKVFPKHFDHVFSQYSNAARLLSKFPKKRQFNLFEKTFNQVFSNSLEKSCTSIKSYYYFHMLKMIVDSEEREKWAQMKYKHEKNNEYMKYFQANNCIDTIQPKLTVLMPVAKTVEYIQTATEACLINNDWKALLRLCELLCGVLKNHDRKIHHKFLEVLMNKEYAQVFLNLTKDHWKYIIQIITKAESSDSAPLILHFMEFTYKNNEDLIEDDITKLMKKSEWVCCLKTFKSDPKTEKKILLFLIQIAPKIVEDDAVEKTNLYLILACIDYSVRHPFKKINVFDYPQLIQSVKKVLSNECEVENYEFTPAFDHIICVPQRNEEVETLTQFYWENFENFATIKATMWFLKYRPEIVVKNIDKFADVLTGSKFCSEYYWCTSKVCKSMWRILKSYDYLQMDKMVAQYCLTKLNDDEVEDKQIMALPLSQILSTEDFIKVIEKFIPSSMKVDQRDDKGKELFQLRRHFLKSCVNLSKSEKILSIVLKFCTDDYVASCISPLSSCLYRVPENRVKVYLDQLCNVGAVSVKKHGFYFVCITQDDATVLNSLKKCHLSQSIAMTFQHFAKNPSIRGWELLKTKLTKLDNNDNFTALVLVNTPAPKEYRSRFFETAYEVFREKKNRFTNVLIDKLHEDTIGHLSDQFFRTLDYKFLDTKKSEFVLSCYLLHCHENSKFDIVLSFVKAYKEHQWSFKSHEGREKISGFINCFSNKYLEEEVTDTRVVETFAKGFLEIFPPVEVFEEFVTLSLIQFKDLERSDMIKSVVGLHNQLTSCYGRLTFAIFADCLDNILKKLYEEEDQLEFFYLLLDSKQSVEDVLLVINLLPKERPRLKQNAQLYDKVLHLLEQIKDQTVQLHLHLKKEQGKSDDTTNA